MAINLATKYSGKVDEVIINGALSAPSVNNDYDWIGAQTVKVYSFDPVSMNNYIAMVQTDTAHLKNFRTQHRK